MKRLLILLFICALGGGAYFYFCKSQTQKPHVKKIIACQAKKSVEPKNDARFTEIEKIAKELFPADNSKRDAWINEQFEALKKIDSACVGLDNMAKSAILEEAQKNYARDFVARASFVKEQAKHAKEFYAKLSSSGLSESENADLAKYLYAEFGCDYAPQSIRLDDIISCLEEIQKIKEKMSPEDFQKISARVMQSLASDPRGTYKFLYSQYLSRHNFLKKEIAPDLGDLRKDIEQKFPDDFVAQENELYARIEAAQNAISESDNVVMGQSGFVAKERFEKLFFKNIAMCDDSKYIGFFVNVNGKKAYVFPFDALSRISGKSFSAGTLNLATDKIYVSGAYSYCVVMTPNEDIAPIDFANLPIEKTKCVLLYLDKNGKFNIKEAHIKGSELEISQEVELMIKYNSLNGGLVVDVQTLKIISLFEVSGKAAVECGKTYFKRNESIASLVENSYEKSAIPESVKVLKDSVLSTKLENMMSIRAVTMSDLTKGKWQLFSAQKFAKESEFIAKANELLFEFAVFMFRNNYADTLALPSLDSAARKFERTFTSGERLNKATFFRQYVNYIREISLAIRSEWKKISVASIDTYYFPYRDYALAQAKLFNNLIVVLNNVVSKSQIKEYVHADLYNNINGDTYVPSQRTVDSGGGGGGGFNFMEGFYQKKKSSKK